MNFSNVDVWSTVRVTAIMSISATMISSVFGILLGLMLSWVKFPGKQIVVKINRTLMGVPPVVVGLIVYMLLMRKGPLGSLKILFTIRGMILAQVLIITPIICGMVYTYAIRILESVSMFAKTMGASKIQASFLLLREMKSEIYFAVITAFGRSISEVGAVMLVGGNIKGSTRTMTTAISMLKSQGIFTEGIFLGGMLLLTAFVLQCLTDFLRKEETYDENE